MNCPNEKCKWHGKGMQNIATICKDYDNHYCGGCGSHYAGYNNTLQYYTKAEWFEMINGMSEKEWNQKNLK